MKKTFKVEIGSPQKKGNTGVLSSTKDRDSKNHTISIYELIFFIAMGFLMGWAVDLINRILFP